MLPRTLARRWLPARLALAAPAAEQMAGGRLCSACSCGPTRPSPSGTVRGGRPGSPSAISPRRSSSTASFAARRSANTSARSASSISCNRWCRRWRSRSAIRRSARPAGPRTASAAATAFPAANCTCFCRAKSSNMDCTFCLDCIHACPHDNIGILVGHPGAELWHDPSRSGIGRFEPAARPGGAGRWCWSSAPSPTPPAWSLRSWSGRIACDRLAGFRRPCGDDGVLPAALCWCCRRCWCGGTPR